MIIALKTDQRQELVQWLADNLFFEKTEQPFTVRNGGCVIAAADCGAVLPEAEYYKGFAHIALRTEGIDEALEYCRARGLSLELDGGRPFFNPGIYGAGEYFFNIVSPFGITFEISQRAAGREKAAAQTGQLLICGLDHMGLRVEHIGDSMLYYGAEGFEPEFDMVTNQSASDGTVYAVMMRKHDIIIELYELADLGEGVADSGRIFVGRE